MTSHGDGAIASPIDEFNALIGQLAAAGTTVDRSPGDARAGVVETDVGAHGLARA